MWPRIRYGGISIATDHMSAYLVYLLKINCKNSFVVKHKTMGLLNFIWTVNEIMDKRKLYVLKIL